MRARLAVGRRQARLIGRVRVRRARRARRVRVRAGLVGRGGGRRGLELARDELGRDDARPLRLPLRRERARLVVVLPRVVARHARDGAEQERRGVDVDARLHRALAPAARLDLRRRHAHAVHERLERAAHRGRRPRRHGQQRGGGHEVGLLHEAAPAGLLARGVRVVLLLDALAPPVLLPQHRVPPVLDRVVRPARDELRDLRPAAAQCLVRAYDGRVLLVRPRVVLDVRVDLVAPA
mmetsp:Transcript_20099/g.50870  ORF Transcript_20099/g.50870 Transcript_20099/m.50870 type:complete len:237 (-) Transcript_20099:103-813(-)